MKDTGSILNILQAGTKDNPQKRQWYGETMAAARKDVFLSYMHQARNFEEHEPRWSADIQNGSFTLDGKGGTYQIQGDVGISIGPEGVILDPGLLQSIEGITPYLQITPGGPVLRDVRDRDGRIYPPPTDFFGRTVSPSDPIDIGELYLSYLVEIVKEAFS